MATTVTTIKDRDLPWGKKYYYYLRVGTTKHNKIGQYFLLSTATVPVVAPRQIDLTMSGTTAF